MVNMIDQKRREILGVAAVALTSGCISNDEPQVEIQEIEVVNLRDESVDVTIVAERDDEIVYEDTFEFDAIQGASTDGVNLEESWMGGEGELVVTVSADSIDERSLSTVSLSQDYEDTECLSVLSTIDTNGVNMYYSRKEC
jgi:hypothetical protein